MGIRLAMFAVNVTRFASVVEQTLSDLLWLHQRTAKKTEPLSTLLLFEHNAGNHIYRSVQSKGVIGGYSDARGRRVTRKLTEVETREIPFLQQSARQFLSRGSAYDLKFFAGALSQCDRVDFIQCLTDGGRRWWIGCVLRQAREVLRARDADYQELELLFRKILRGLNTDYPIPQGDVGVDLSGFPVIPKPDVDLRIGFWSREDTWLAIELVGELLASDVLFSPPPESLRDYPSAPECDAWIRAELQPLAQLGALASDDTVVLSFIG